MKNKQSFFSPLTCSGFVEFPVPADVVAKVTARKQVHNQIQVLSILKSIVHVDEERMVLELSKDAPLAHNGLDTALGQDPGLAHLLHGEHVHVLRPLVLHLPYLTETALSNALLVFEQVLAHSCDCK